MVQVMAGRDHVHHAGGEQHVVYSPLFLSLHVISPGVAQGVWVKVPEGILQIT